jgi:hypothetical protein
MPLPAFELKCPWAASKTGPRHTKRNRAIKAPVDGTVACLAGLLRQGAPCHCRRLGRRALGRLEKLAHVARCDSALATHLWTARQRVLQAYCVS